MRRNLTAAVVSRSALAALALGLAATLSACTTVEGTNALTDFGTFEREVMTSTLQGMGIVDPPPKKEPIANYRAPLAMPKTTAVLPTPQQATAQATLPEDSDAVQINTAGLSEDDLKRLRRARVVDLRTLAGRPLTEAEARQLQARMSAAGGAGAEHSLIVPPEEYFTTVEGQDYVCLNPRGDLVPVSDPSCPASIKKALGAG